MRSPSTVADWRGEADVRAHPRRVGHDVEPVDPRASLGREGEGGEDADRGRLAGTVVAEQAEHAAGGDRQVEVAQRPQVAVALAEALGGDPAADSSYAV